MLINKRVFQNLNYMLDDLYSFQFLIVKLHSNKKKIHKENVFKIRLTGNSNAVKMVVCRGIIDVIKFVCKIKKKTKY